VKKQGHEHECLIEFFESVVGTFRITQPGSSVATSLVPGEAARKKVGILDIKGKNFRLHPVPLTQVRSFVMTELSLRENRANLDPEDPKVDGKVTKLLEEEVQLMVLQARDKAKEILAEAREAGSDAGDDSSMIKYKVQRPDEVLVRLRVDHVGFSTLNNQRFGAKFLGDVANPNDILLFHRKKDPKLASTVKIRGIKPIAPEELERTNVEDLVREHLLAVPDGKLQLFGEKDLSEALEECVDKSVIAAIPDLASDILDKTQKTLIKGKKGEEPIAKESQILDVLDREASSKDLIMEKESRRMPIRSNAAENSLQDDDSDEHDDTGNRTISKAELPDESFSIPTSRPFEKVTRDRPKRQGTKRKVAYALGDSDDEEVISDAIVDSDDDDEVNELPPPSKRKTPSQRTRAKPKAATSRKTATSAATGRKKVAKPSNRAGHDDSDNESASNRYNGESADQDGDWGSAVAKTPRGRW
jgi:double-strand break repair protein MRE11